MNASKAIVMMATNTTAKPAYHDFITMLVKFQEDCVEIFRKYYR
jgi:hypothetical protein